jgi:hypothetical protein
LVNLESFHAYVEQRLPRAIRPGDVVTAKGLVFITLEDEFSDCNITVWSQALERFHAIAMGARRLMRRLRRRSRTARGSIFPPTSPEWLMRVPSLPQVMELTTMAIERRQWQTALDRRAHRACGLPHELLRLFNAFFKHDKGFQVSSSRIIARHVLASAE